MKRVILQILRLAATIQLKKINCRVIGVTGSIGKTSCKDFLYELLATKYVVRKTPKSLNSESGVPLAILGQESGYSNPWLWLKVFGRVLLTLMFDSRKADYFIIEMGVDKPGDMDYLLSFIKPFAAIFLGVAPVHTANFSMFSDPLKAIYEEKRKLLKALPKDGILVEVSSMNTDELVDLRFPNVYGNGFSQTLGTAAILAQKLGITKDDIQAVATNFKLAPGRMSLLPGIKETLVIDSSYNASKYPMLMALDVLVSFKDRRKIAVLGDMRELGAMAKTEHEEVARKAVEIAEEIVLVGPLMRDYFAPEALKLGFSKDCLHWLADSTQAADFLINKVIKGGEAILVKGSQNTIFLEQVVYALMLEKEKAKDLLCRQEPEWEKIRNNDRIAV